MCTKQSIAVNLLEVVGSLRLGGSSRFCFYDFHELSSPQIAGGVIFPRAEVRCMRMKIQGGSAVSKRAAVDGCVVRCAIGRDLVRFMDMKVVEIKDLFRC